MASSRPARFLLGLGTLTCFFMSSSDMSVCRISTGRSMCTGPYLPVVAIRKDRFIISGRVVGSVTRKLCLVIGIIRLNESAS